MRVSAARPRRPAPAFRRRRPARSAISLDLGLDVLVRRPRSRARPATASRSSISRTSRSALVAPLLAPLLTSAGASSSCGHLPLHALVGRLELVLELALDHARRAPSNAVRSISASNSDLRSTCFDSRSLRGHQIGCGCGPSARRGVSKSPRSFANSSSSSGICFFLTAATWHAKTASLPASSALPYSSGKVTFTSTSSPDARAHELLLEAGDEAPGADLELDALPAAALEGLAVDAADEVERDTTWSFSIAVSVGLLDRGRVAGADLLELRGNLARRRPRSRAARRAARRGSGSSNFGFTSMRTV